jgi:bacterioferritin-associated ferredoxin
MIAVAFGRAARSALASGERFAMWLSDCKAISFELFQTAGPMIVCSCNVLSDTDVRGCLNPGPDCPRTPAQVYRCLGCSPECGHCARTIRRLMDEALAAAAAEHSTPCTRGCCAASALAQALSVEADLKEPKRIPSV